MQVRIENKNTPLNDKRLEIHKQVSKNGSSYKERRAIQMIELIRMQAQEYEL